MKKILEELKNKNYLKGIKVEFESEVITKAELQQLANTLKDLDNYQDIKEVFKEIFQEQDLSL